MVNDKINVVGTNIAEKASMIWNVADMLRGPFKSHEYVLVILPMTVVKRFHDCLLPTHDCRELIVKAYGEYRNNTIYCDKNGIYCESKIFDLVEFGYNKIVVERPLRDENGEIVTKKR